MQPVAMGIGFTHNDGTTGKAIQIVTTPWWGVFSKERRFETATHSYPWFRDTSGNVEYFEALEGHGWQGPFPDAKVHEWAEKEPDRWVQEYDLTKFLGLTREQMRLRYEFCHDMLEYWTYNTPQLLLQLRTAGIGRRIVRASPRDVICSEASSRILHSDLFDFREWTNKKSFDHITPENQRMAVERLLREK